MLGPALTPAGSTLGDTAGVAAGDAVGDAMGDGDGIGAGSTAGDAAVGVDPAAAALALCINARPHEIRARQRKAIRGMGMAIVGVCR